MNTWLRLRSGSCCGGGSCKLGGGDNQSLIRAGQGDSLDDMQGGRQSSLIAAGQSGTLEEEEALVVWACVVYGTPF